MAHQNKDKWYWMHRELRKLINDWELIPGCPSDEFDSLNFKLLSLFQNSFDDVKLYSILEAELTITYGLSPEKEEIHQMADEIKKWWATKQ